MVTNVGSLGLEEAYVPLVPYSRVPLLIAMGEVRDSAVVVDGDVKVAKTMKIFATFDHRILDGSHAAKMVKVLKAWFDDPYAHFDNLDEAEASSVTVMTPGEEEVNAGATAQDSMTAQL